MAESRKLNQEIQNRKGLKWGRYWGNLAVQIFLTRILEIGMVKYWTIQRSAEECLQTQRKIT